MPAAKKTLKINQEIKKTAAELLDKLQVSATVEVSKETDDLPAGQAGHYKVNIETTETGLLIGYHGETLNSLQLLLGVILYKKLGKWVRVVLDVGDYRKAREENIKEMVNRITAEVEETSQPVVLPYLTPYERRIVHMMLSDNPKFASESEGEGKDRRIVIKPRPIPT
jgi:spoIIIJ-associated protein